MVVGFFSDPIKIVFTILIAFIPSIIYAIIIRYSEKYEREPWGSIGQAFLWGGTLAVVAVILIRGFFDFHLQENYPLVASDVQKKTLILVCLITPFAAELIKPIGLLLVRVDINEAEDGLIYGAVIGLGYTATENVLFGIFLASAFGIEMFMTVIFIRSMSVMFIQSSTTALTSYGITRAMKVKHKTGSFFAFPIFLFSAIGIHALFNYLVFSGVLDYQYPGEVLFSMSASLLFSIVFAFVLVIFIYVKIYRLDRMDSKEKDEEQEPVQGQRRMPERDQYYDDYGPSGAPARSSNRPPPRRDQYYDDPYYDDYYDQPQPRGRPPPRPPGQRPVHHEFPSIYEPPASGRVSPHATPRPPMRSRAGPPPRPQQKPTPRPPRSLAPPPVSPQPRPSPRPKPRPRPPNTQRHKMQVYKDEYDDDMDDEPAPSRPVGTVPKPDSGARKKQKVITEEEDDEENDAEDEETTDVDWDM
jgi:RsiW-degrading membrane proteinase PrsW (M82 family)